MNTLYDVPLNVPVLVATAVTPDLAVGHCDCSVGKLGASPPSRASYSPPVLFPRSHATSSRAHPWISPTAGSDTIWAPELGNASLSSVPKDAPVILCPSIPTYRPPPDAPRGLPSLCFYFPCVISFTTNAARCAWICTFLFSLSRCSYLVLICLQCGLADITTGPSM
jgi:hypothetical protein